MRQIIFWLNPLVVGFMLCVLPVGEIQSGDNDLPFEYESKMLRTDYASLNGINAIHLWFLLPDSVECLSLRDSATMGHTIEYDLKGAGISLLTAAESVALEDSTGRRLPVLMVEADFFEDDYESLCVYSIDVHFRQICAAPNDLGFGMMVTTWHTSTFGWASCDLLPTELGKAVDLCISRFVKDYLFANQEGYLEKRKAVEEKWFGPSGK